MKYTVDIWFDNICTTLVIENTSISDRATVQIIADRITERLGGDWCSIHCWEE